MLFGDEEEPAITWNLRPSHRRTLPMASVVLQSKSSAPPPIFHPLAYRGVVAEWPVEWRERWGRRANALEESGLSWRDAEAQAFVEVWTEIRRQHSVESTTPNVMSSGLERN